MVEKSLQILAPYHLIQLLPCIRRHRARRIPHEFAESLLRAGGEATRTEALQIRRRKNQGLAEGEFQEILKLEAEGRSVLSQEVLFEADFLLERRSGGQTRVGLDEGEDILGLGMAEGVVVGLLGGQGDKFLGDPGDLFQIAKTGVVGGKQRHSSAQSP